MRIVIAHSRYLSASSGENEVVADEARLLAEAGHHVARYEPTPDDLTQPRSVRSGLSALWSRSATAALRDLLRDTRAEVLHCHNLFPMLSPAVLRLAAEENVAVVVTLHNYRMLCPAASLLRDGRPCEDCVGRVPWRSVVHRCYRESALGSAAIATSLTMHRALRTFEQPALYLTVSDFVRTKHIAAGWDPARLRVKENFTWPITRREGPGEVFVYVGRLSEEKGLAPLLRTWRSAPGQLVVVGDGPQARMLRDLAPPTVQFTGAISRDEVDALLQRARALVLPSICYEGQPRTVLEAYAAGVPVLTHRLGGLAELVRDDVTGRTIAVGDERGWLGALEQLGSDEDVRRLGKAAYELWSERFSPAAALRALERAYEDAIAGVAA
jgi:glycosyltransferase involved in cell wall biosynthesis